MNQCSPSPRVFHYDCFEFFRKFAEIFAAQGLPPESTTLVANGKIFNQKKFNNFIWSPLGSRGNIYKFLPSSSLSGVCSLILFQLFAAGVVDTSGNR
jgi:hypothetical protein